MISKKTKKDMTKKMTVLLWHYNCNVLLHITNFLDKLQPKFLYWPQSNQNDCTDA